MKTPTPEYILEAHSAYLNCLDREIEHAIDEDIELDIDSLISDPPACDDAFDAARLATESNIRLMVNYLSMAGGHIDEVVEGSLFYETAKASADLAVEITIATVAKALGVDGHLLWSTLANGKNIHAPTVHLYDGSNDEWRDGRTKEKVSPPE